MGKNKKTKVFVKLIKITKMEEKKIIKKKITNDEEENDYLHNN